MLTKTQSLGMTTSPAKISAGESHRLPKAGLSTPTHIQRTQFLPESPIKLDVVESDLNTTALLVLGPIAGQEGSGGKAKRTYGRSRTYLAPSHSNTDIVESAEPNLAVNESYDELRRKYEVDNSSFEGSGSGNMVSVSGP
jgi:hypothetical protein